MKVQLVVGLENGWYVPLQLSCSGGGCTLIYLSCGGLECLIDDSMPGLDPVHANTKINGLLIFYNRFFTIYIYVFDNNDFYINR